jgi:hypothetical protein
MLDILTDRQVVLILASFHKVFKNNDIEHLTNSAYKFIMQSPGFIAHYDLYGFRCEYENVTQFRREILQSQSMNQWSNFRPGEKDYFYMMQKKDIYNKICELARATWA